MLYYFDTAATTPVYPAVVEAMTQSLSENFGNPSSRYPLGQAAAARLKADRAAVASALGCGSEELFFTSCGTEGDNWAIRAAAALKKRRGSHIVTTALEHSAVLEPMKALEQQGFEVTYLSPDKTGHISIADVKAALRPDTILVSMMLVNNELGTLLPVAETAQAIRAAGCPALLHCDAVQGFLKTKFTPKQLGVDFLAISGHKVNGPKGIGALYIRKGIKANAMLLGGGQENALRSGTEATAQIAGFAAACRIGTETMEQNLTHMTELKAYALSQLNAALPDLEVISRGDVPHICAVTLPGYKSEVIVRVLGDRGVCLSSGSACHKGKPSHVYAALGLPKAWLDGALRISFSGTTTKEEVDVLVRELKSAQEGLFPTLS